MAKKLYSIEYRYVEFPQWLVGTDVEKHFRIKFLNWSTWKRYETEKDRDKAFEAITSRDARSGRAHTFEFRKAG